MIKDEKCDNMIQITIEFLENISQMVKGNKALSNTKIVVRDVKQPCMILGQQVVWGYQEIIKWFLNQQ